MVYHWVNSKCGRLGVGTYSGAWVSRYIQQSYIRIDPVVLGGFQRFHPVDWKDLDWSSKAARAGFIGTARRDLILIAHYFNKKILDIEAEGIVDPSPVLSPRENETLTFLALGYSRASCSYTMHFGKYIARLY